MSNMGLTRSLEQQETLAAAALPIARVLLAAPFLVSGLRQLLAWDAAVAYFGKVGLMMPELLAPIVVALEIGGGILLIIGWRRLLVALALAAFTIGAAFIGHAFWNAEGPQYSNQLNHFLKNFAMAGGLLCVAMTPTAKRVA